MFGATAGKEFIEIDQDDRFEDFTINEVRQEGPLEQIFVVNQHVSFTKGGSSQFATIVGIHHDEYLQPYYTVNFRRRR